MMIIENFRLALSSIKANKMRSLLTMLGIIIGIASVIAIMTVGNSLTNELTGSMSDMGAMNLNVMVSGRPAEDSAEAGMSDEEAYFMEDNFNTSRRKMVDSDYITMEMIENYCEAFPDEVIGIDAIETVGNATCKDGKKSANITLYGNNYGALYVDNLTMLAGRYFNDSEMTQGSKVCIVSDIVVENMFDGDMDEALGSTISAEVDGLEYNFVITGIYEYKETASAFALSTSRKNTTTDMYIPMRTARAIEHKDDTYTEFSIILASDVDADEMATKTKEYFNDNYYAHNDTYYVTVFSLASTMESLTSLMNTLTVAISVIAGIALLVGGIGVMNIMMVSITERTREIGTRKALGATNASIRMQFIIESIVLCVIGGIIGMILGICLGLLANKLIDVSGSVSLSSIVISLGFSTAIGIFFGYYPANKAAKMDPIEALRYE